MPHAHLLVLMGLAGAQASSQLGFCAQGRVQCQPLAIRLNVAVEGSWGGEGIPGTDQGEQGPAGRFVECLEVSGRTGSSAQLEQGRKGWMGGETEGTESANFVYASGSSLAFTLGAMGSH